MAWRSAAESGGRSAWLGWRSVAEQLVRDGDLEGAVAAYREADRRAPPAERGAIANRIAWLLKETGHDFAARRQFNRARGAYATHTPYVTYAIIAICVGALRRRCDPRERLDARRRALRWGALGPIGEANLINAFAVAEGEWWVIFTSAFIHLSPLHLAFNMFVLYQYGSLVERMYGHLEYALIYLLCAAGGSVLTILVDPTQSAAGASGAIFGLVGLLFVVSRRHHAVLGREARTMVAGIGGFVIYLLVFTFVVSRDQLDRPRRRPDRRRGARLLPATDRRRHDERDVAHAERGASARVDAGRPAAGHLRRSRPGARGRVVRRGRSPDRLIHPPGGARVMRS